MIQSSPLADFAQCPAHSELRAFLFEHNELTRSELCALHIEKCSRCRQLVDSWLYDDSPARTDADASAASDEIAAWDRVGKDLGLRFRYQGLIGRGSTSTVYRAWDRILKREVAIKVPHEELRANPVARSRLEVEAGVAAQLLHPHIVPLVDRISTGETTLLVFEYVEGVTLCQWIDRNCRSARVDERVAAQLIMHLADGIAAAHARNILHRDLKPANVILDDSLPDGRLPFTPRIMDFGCSRLDGFSEHSTETGTVIGTYLYMSPEQAEGRRREFGPETDIYSLGVMLFEILSGKRPIEAENRAESLERTVSVDPVQLHVVRPGVSRDLAWICMKCLNKEVSRRYRSAVGLRDDLRRFLCAESLPGRPPALLEDLSRFASRHPLATAFVTLLILCLTLVFLSDTLKHFKQSNQASIVPPRASLEKKMNSSS